MPIGGSNIGWDNTTPADTESAGQGDDRIRSMKTSVQQALDNEHEFPVGGGAATGSHRTGSARVYYGTQSQVSSSGMDGRLMMTSDTSQLYHVGSGYTALLGGPVSGLSNLLSINGATGGLPAGYKWVEQFGAVTTAGESRSTFTFSSLYSGNPNVLLTGWSATNFPYLLSVTTRTFIVGQSDPTGFISVHWRSIGTMLI
jgi:hypothetical protein